MVAIARVVMRDRHPLKRPNAMQVDQLVDYLDSSEKTDPWLRSLGVENVQRAHAGLVHMTELGITLDLIGVMCEQFEEHLPRISDPDMALNNLDRFLDATRSPLAFCSLIERDLDALPILLQIFSTSQYLSDLLVFEPEGFDLLRLTDGQPVARDMLVGDICTEVAAMADNRQVLAALRRFKRRETLRIAFGDIIHGQSIETVTKQISFLADAICEAAVQTARRDLEAARGVPRRADGERARFVILALGKLGGTELNYSSDIDLMFLYDSDGQTDGTKQIANGEFFDRMARHTVKLLTESTELGTLYRVDLRLRPQGSYGPMVISQEAAEQYYDVMGRTWERQAFVKARPIAGDLDFGQEFLAQLEPWIYRQYLTLADITGIKALKRRIEQRALHEGGDLTNVKTGHGGIRDIEFVIQFLQLLNGGDIKEIRTGNTLEAIAALESVGCLTMQERMLLTENYSFLRKVEHRLQLMLDLQTHTISEDEDELRKLAIRMGYLGTPHCSARAAFETDYRAKKEVNRGILDHLLHDAFGEDGQTDPEIDLVLDPDPSAETIRTVLEPYRFKDIDSAYANLMALSVERVRFLSTRRCRHFLAAMAPRLLQAISETPDPDATLVNLSKVSDSLGGKGALWELFSFNTPTLQLYVRLCASSPYLSDILTSNPGMIDELMDTLVLDRLPETKTIFAMLDDLSRGAEEIEPILHSFKNSFHLRVGVRDILGKANIRQAHRVLADIAEVCLKQIADREFETLIEKHGTPTIGEGPRAGESCELIILALGKMGGSEPNYHSDLDAIFLYEAAGNTKPVRPSQRDRTTTNQHFFGQLAQRITKIINHTGPFGRLFELDPRLRPTGRNGALVVPLSEFARYFAEGDGQLWERQMLCKARPIYGAERACNDTMEIVWNIISEPEWRSEFATEIRKMRGRLEESAGKHNLKRGLGGTVDIEFTVQMLQMTHAIESPEVLVPGTLAALDALHEAGHLIDDDYDFFTRSYRFLRSVEARLRLMNTTARHDVPSDKDELTKLAYLFDYADGEALRTDCQNFMAENRVRFNRLFDAAERV